MPGTGTGYLKTNEIPVRVGDDDLDDDDDDNHDYDDDDAATSTEGQRVGGGKKGSVDTTTCVTCVHRTLRNSPNYLRRPPTYRPPHLSSYYGTK